MPRTVRVQTDYKGVSYVEKNGDRVFYITYRRPESRKLYEEKLGRKSQGWTVARAAAERARRMTGQAQNNEEKRQASRLAKLAESEKPTIDRLWQLYLETKGSSLKGLATDKNRYELHIKSAFGKKTPQELAPLDIDRLRLNLIKEHSSKTVSNVLELLRRIVNFGVRKKLCPILDWTIQLPKADPDSERIEILTDEQFRKLHEVWDSYHDQHIAHLHQFIAWTGSRASEPLKLLWSDVDFNQRLYTKRDTKSGKSLIFPMSDKLHYILQEQRELLEDCPEVMRTSRFVFPGPAGGQRKLDSYLRHFRRIRDLAGIPEEYRPNYCLRDTVASRLLSSGATLDEVAYQLGHSPGSPMTRRYARFLESAQRGIADRTQRVMDEMLRPIDTELRKLK
jgi:integrase